MSDALAGARIEQDRVTQGTAALRLKQWAVVLVIAVAALWPAILNGGPLWMPDTPSYVRAAASAGAEVVGIETAWTAEYDRLYRAEGATPAPSAGMAAATTTAPAEAAPAGIPVTLKGRSIYYGFLLYSAYLLGSFWLAVLVQSVLAALCTTLTLTALFRAAGKPVGNGTVAIIGAGLAILTPVGFFAAYLMPDIFGALALLALMNLLFLWPHHDGRARAFFLGVLAFALLAHSLNLLLALLLLAAAGLWRLLDRKGPEVRGLAGASACVIVGFAGQIAFDRAVQHFTGAPPVRPPFIAMRLIADGPGLAYLKAHCADEPYLYCRVKDANALHSDTLLWSRDPGLSLFRGLPNDEQRISAAQERQFITRVFAEQPVDVLAAIVSDSLLQMIRFDLSGFNYSAGIRARLAEAVPPPLHAGIVPTSAYREALLLRPTEMSTLAVTLVSVILILTILFSPGARRVPPAVRNACLFILFAVALNAALSGALSGPKGRYQMRLIWVLPLVAAGVLASRPRSPDARLS